MKKIKYVLIAFIIIFLTGCNVEYDLDINEDKSVSEKVIATENTNKMESWTKSKGSQSITYLYNLYKRDGVSDVKTSVKDKNTTAVVTKSHSNIEEYAQDFSSDIFDEVEVTKKDGVVSFTASQTKMLGGTSSYSPLYDEVIVKIRIPYVVVDNNADSVNRNVYTWNINKNEGLKTINFTYKEDNKVNSLNVKINDKTYNINYGIIVLSGIIVLLLIIFIIVSIKNKKNNVVN